MLFVLFQLGGDWYALPARDVQEVLPLVEVKRIPQAPPGVVGIFDFRGSPVPLVDMNQIALGRPAARRASTRILLVRHPDAQGEEHLLGLIAERVTETLRREPVDFVPSGVKSQDAAYLGPVTNDERGMVQWVFVNELLPHALRAALFREAVVS
jgi:chemotaxis-related protein WspB